MVQQTRTPSSTSDTKDWIQHVALQQFGLHGYEGTSMATIADAAGYAKPLIYCHFSSKNDLWRSAVKRSANRLTDDFSELKNQLSAIEPALAIRLIIHRYTHLLCVHNRPLLNVIVQEMGRGGSRANWLKSLYLKPIYQLTVGLLTTASQSGHFKAIDPVRLMLMINGAISGFYAFSSILETLYEVDMASEAVARKHSEYVTDILLNGLRASDRRSSAPPP